MISKIAASIIIGVAFLASTASAQPSSGFYRDKRINLLIGSNPGGGYDLYGRLASRHLARFLDGAPTVIVRNMPGAASLVAANHLYRRAPSDGTEIGVINQSLVLNQAFKDSAVEFDLPKFNWIGRLASTVEMTVVWNPSPVKTIEDAKNRELILAASSASGVSAGMPRVLNAIVGTKFKIIPGYAGRNQINLAMERKEVEGGYTTMSQLLTENRDWLAEKKVSILVQYSRTRHPTYADVPAMVEFGRTEEEKQILAIFGSMADIGRTLVAPPRVEKNRVAELRAAFDAMVADAEFLGDVAKINIELDPLSGDGLQKLIETTFDVPPATMERAEKAWNSKEKD